MTKAEFDQRYRVIESGQGFGLWDLIERKFEGRHGLERKNIECRRAFIRQNCE